MNVDELIEKYLEGETTPVEEKALRDFLLSSAAAGKYKDIRLMMEGFESAVKLGTDRVNPFDSIRKARRILFPVRYISAAAIVLITLSVYLFYNWNKQEGVIITEKNIAANSELSQREISNAFTKISETYEAAFINLDIINQGEEIINPFEKLELINKYSKNRKVKS